MSLFKKRILVQFCGKLYTLKFDSSLIRTGNKYRDNVTTCESSYKHPMDICIQSILDEAFSKGSIDMIRNETERNTVARLENFLAPKVAEEVKVRKLMYKHKYGNRFYGMLRKILSPIGVLIDLKDEFVWDRRDKAWERYEAHPKRHSPYALELAMSYREWLDYKMHHRCSDYLKQMAEWEKKIKELPENKPFFVVCRKIDWEHKYDPDIYEVFGVYELRSHRYVRDTLRRKEDDTWWKVVDGQIIRNQPEKVKT